MKPPTNLHIFLGLVPGIPWSHQLRTWDCVDLTISLSHISPKNFGCKVTRSWFGACTNACVSWKIWYITGATKVRFSCNHIDHMNYLADDFLSKQSWGFNVPWFLTCNWGLLTQEIPQNFGGLTWRRWLFLRLMAQLGKSTTGEFEQTTPASSKSIELCLGGGFKYFLFPSPIWGNDPIWRSYFSDGLVQPPTRIELWGYSKIPYLDWGIVT